jgi:hypothetical protein
LACPLLAQFFVAAAEADQSLNRDGAAIQSRSRPESVKIPSKCHSIGEILITAGPSPLLKERFLEKLLMITDIDC